MLEKQLKNFSEHVIFPVSLDNETSALPHEALNQIARTGSHEKPYKSLRKTKENLESFHSV